MRTTLGFAVLPFLFCCGGSSDHPEPTSDASAPVDASAPADASTLGNAGTDASSEHDAGADGPAGDARADQVADDAGAADGGSTANACAGPAVGTWRDSAHSVQLVLNEDCSFAFTAPTCTASGRSTPIDPSTGVAYLTVTSATGDRASDAGVPYPCFDKQIYPCIFQGEANGSVRYYCMGTGASAPAILTR